MRLKSEIWVKAYVRQRNAAGGFAGVVRHGDDDAGAIYIRINRLDGTSLLFGPAPAGLDGLETDRRWIAALKSGGNADADVDAYLADVSSFDPDAWIIEVEDRSGAHGLDGWLM